MFEIINYGKPHIVLKYKIYFTLTIMINNILLNMGFFSCDSQC